jgi:hypothetical protein
MVLSTLAVLIGACALLAPLGKDDEARRAARITLSAYETTQQALLIYGRLPSCGPLEPSKICKDPIVWSRLKVVEAAATRAIAEATPVLNGAQVDAGQLAAALAAIDNVKKAVRDAQASLEGGSS